MDEFNRRIRHRLRSRENDDPEQAPESPRALAQWLQQADGLSADRHQDGDATCWVIRYRSDMLWPDRPPTLRQCLPGGEPDDPTLQALTEHDPARWTFLDTETLGLRSVPVFLVGYLTFADGRPAVTQVLAQNVRQEGTMLRRVSERLRETSVILSFNGKSFDMPLLEKRARRWGVRLPRREDYLHVDLLTHSRRLWRDRLPNCKLSTVENRICGRNREADVPGSQVPRLYRLFTETGDARILAPILRHNAIDVASLVDILGAMTGRRAGS